MTDIQEELESVAEEEPDYPRRTSPADEPS